MRDLSPSSVIAPERRRRLALPAAAQAPRLTPGRAAALALALTLLAPLAHGADGPLAGSDGSIGVGASTAGAAAVTSPQALPARARPDLPDDLRPGPGQAAEPAAEAVAPSPPSDPASALPAGAPAADDLNTLLRDLPATLGGPATLDEPRDLWERVRRGFLMPDLDSRLVDDRARWYAAQPQYFARMAARSSRYLFHILEEIDRRGMPTELALLPFVESAFQPEAVSSAKAAGLWQFIPSTGKDFDLQQNMWKDERRGIVQSTRAALDYLQKLYDMFGDWHLALAAYNWGEGSVARAISKNSQAGRPTDYASLNMPAETRGYVPKLMAIKAIVADPQRYGIALTPIENEPYFVQVRKERDIDVKTAARLADMKLDEFIALNPAFNKPVIIGAANELLLLPADKVDTFHANLAAFEATGQPLASWAAVRVTEGDTLAALARRAGIAEQKLREANGIPPRYRIATGSTILIPRDETMDADISAAALGGQLALVPERSNLRRVTYRVRAGDTVASVARRYKVEPAEVVAWNSLRSQNLFAGQRLNLMIEPPPARPVARRAAPTRTATAGPTRSATAAPATRTQRATSPAGAKAVAKAPARKPATLAARR